MKFAIYDRSRRGFLEGGDFRTILWGRSDLSIDDAKLYNDKKKAETAAKSMTTYYQQTSARPDFQQPKYAPPDLLVQRVDLVVHVECLP